MTHWIIAPVIFPALLAPFIVLAARYHIGIQRVISVIGTLAHGLQHSEGCSHPVSRPGTHLWQFSLSLSGNRMHPPGTAAL